jgi:hypothetical protein
METNLEEIEIEIRTRLERKVKTYLFAGACVFIVLIVLFSLYIA